MGEVEGRLVTTDGERRGLRLPQLGDLLASKYRVVRVVGEGGMGVVYEGLHEKLGQRVAIKVVRVPDGVVPDEYLRRFAREARAAAKLQGPNVARVSDVDALPDGTPFMVMEYLEGTDLDAELTLRGALPIKEAVDYVLQACSAVAEAHSRGIVHRDLKPHNLFLATDGSRRVVKLLDFGISRVVSEQDNSVTLTRSSLGTPLYMSPEQIRSTRRADERSDIWSFGVILYELLTGATPFSGESPSSVIAAITADTPVPPNVLRPEIPPTLAAAVMKALEKNPALRYQKVGELAQALLPFGPHASWLPPPPDGSRVSYARVSIPDAPTIPIAALTVPGPEPPPAEPVAKPRRLGPMLAIALGVSVVVAVVAFKLFVSRAPNPPVAAQVDPAASTAAAPPAGVAPAPEITSAGPSVAPSVVPALETERRGRALDSRHTRGAPKAPPPPSAKPAPAPPPAPTENPVHL